MVTYLRLVIVVVVAFFAAAWALPDGLGQSSAVKIIVLRTGRVLRGEVTRLGERSVIVLENGGQIQLPSRDIAVEAASLQEAYQTMSSTLTSPEQIDGHLELASWCIREGLPSQATSELLEALKIDPNDPRIDRLSRQLEFMAQAKAAPKRKSPEATTEKAVTAKQLDDLAKSMPKESVEQFTSSVQLLLLSRCGTARCHDASSTNSLRLVRPAKGERFWRSLTLRNLYATKIQIDSNQPQASPLLRMATTPHGGSKNAVFQKSDSTQFASLADWVSLATNTAIDRDEFYADQSEFTPRPLVANPGARPLANTKVPADQFGPVVPADAEAEDPFDPADFNEQP